MQKKPASAAETKSGASKRSSMSVPAMSKTLNNRSSVNHNIITHQENLLSNAIVPGLLDK